MAAIAQLILLVLGIIVILVVIGIAWFVISMIGTVISWLIGYAFNGCFSIIFWIIVILCAIALII